MALTGGKSRMQRREMMAKKAPVQKLERTYNVPLRKEFLKVPPYKRAKKAVKALREFVVKHMKSDNVNIGADVNYLIWKKGIKSPPHHVKVVVSKEDDKVSVVLEGKKKEEKKEVKKEKKEVKAEKPVEEKKEAPLEKPKEEKKEVKPSPKQVKE